MATHPATGQLGSQEQAEPWGSLASQAPGLIRDGLKTQGGCLLKGAKGCPLTDFTCTCVFMSVQHMHTHNKYSRKE